MCASVIEVVRVVIQARMSSSRFPGKVLAPFRGAPLIRSVLSAVQQALPIVPIVVATSVQSSDDPLVGYLATLDIPVFRGPLDRVFDRFLGCADTFPARWLLRVNADSPVLAPEPLRGVVAHADRSDLDLITTTFPRTFPRGHNAEMIRVDTMRALDRNELTALDQEHVTQFFYRNSTRFRILNVESGDPSLASRSFAVDTLDDLRRLEGDEGVRA